MKCFIISLINLARRAEIDTWCIRLPAIARPSFTPRSLDPCSQLAGGNVCKVKVRRCKVSEIVHRFCDNSISQIYQINFAIFASHRPSTQAT